MNFRHRLWLFPVYFILFIGVALAKDAGDWGRWRGSNFDGTFEGDVFKGDFGLKIGWEKELGSGYSSIAVSSGKLITMFSDSTFDYVIALDVKSGEELWRYKIDSTYTGHTGSHNGPISTPAIEGNLVFALGPKGQFVALKLKNGKQVWSVNLPEGHSSVAPFYGFTTSPAVYGDHVFIETGGKDNNTISALNKKTGKIAWAAGADSINYQSPVIFEFEGETHLVCAGDKYLCGFNPENGETLWKYFHNTGVTAINPTYLGDGKIFFGVRGRRASTIRLQKNGDTYEAKEIWNTREQRGTWNPSVLQDSVLYGYSGRFLAAIHAGTGKRVWKSRPPGDGYAIIVDKHLVVLTRQGSIHISKAEPKGYQELAALQVFNGPAWTSPIFANGRIFARNLTTIAAIDIVPKEKATPSNIPIAATTPDAGKAPVGSKFAGFISELEQSDNQKEMIDKFMSEQKSFPVIEGKRYAHIIYRGDAEDVALGGDMLDFNIENQLHRVAGTDFFYYSVELEPDARVNYRLNLNLTQGGPDPLNKGEQIVSVFGPSSEIAMPDFQRPAHLQTPTGARGIVDSLNFESKILSNSRILHVYTPVGYKDSDNRYPVVYVNYGRQAIQNGLMLNTLDNVVGKTVEPMIAVLIEAPNSFAEYARGQRDQYAQMIAEEIVPTIDAKYRTHAEARYRAFMGGDEGGYAAIYTTFKHPGVFGLIGGQSTHLLGNGNGGDELRAIVNGSDMQDVRFYLEWSKYTYQSGRQQFSWRDLNKAFAENLIKKGYEVGSAEINQGWGWASWRTRTDKVLEAFYPIESAKK